MPVPTITAPPLPDPIFILVPISPTALVETMQMPPPPPIKGGGAFDPTTADVALIPPCPAPGPGPSPATLAYPDSPPPVIARHGSKIESNPIAFGFPGTPLGAKNSGEPIRYKPSALALLKNPIAFTPPIPVVFRAGGAAPPVPPPPDAAFVDDVVVDEPPA